MLNQTASKEQLISESDSDYIRLLKAYAFRGIERMYVPDRNRFVFRIKRDGDGTVSEGLSLRYTAITLIGLSNEDSAAVDDLLGKGTVEVIFASIVGDINKVTNVGDAALCLWAANAWKIKDRGAFLRHLVTFDPVSRAYPLVELSWVLDAFCAERELAAAELAHQMAARLLNVFNSKSGLFPHIVGERSGGLRSHVTCFADAVYPTLALSHYHQRFNDPGALKTAVACADAICKLQGRAGQWWWHYDYRTGTVVEGYPVYSVHQDAMAPMALFAATEAGGPDYSAPIKKGLDWLAHSPEIRGSLVDSEADLIWRKVARREPGKITRYLQAGASRLHPKLRVPDLDRIAPAVAIDYENRPYHLGWIMYAWPERRVKDWK